MSFTAWNFENAYTCPILLKDEDEWWEALCMGCGKKLYGLHGEYCEGCMYAGEFVRYGYFYRYSLRKVLAGRGMVGKYERG